MSNSPINNMFIYSQHFLEQFALRNIPLAKAENVLNHPQQISKEDGLTVYQKTIQLHKKTCLLRIFVNEVKYPPVVVTAYQTSKLNKYLLP